MLPLLVFLILVSFPQRTISVSQTRSAVTQIEARFTTALIKKEEATFAELLANDLVHIGFEGQTAGKAEYMSFFKQGSWQYKKYEPTNLVVKDLGNTSVVTGRVDRTIVIEGKEISGAFAFTHVWTKTGNRWQLTSSQLTTIPTPTS